jgi:hypothetical protein
MIKSGTISPEEARATIKLITSPEIMEESPNRRSTKKTNPRELF